MVVAVFGVGNGVRWGGCGDGVTVVVFGCVVAGGGGCGLLKGFCGGYVLFYFNEFFILF